MARLAAPPTTSFAHSYAGEFDTLLESDRRAALAPGEFGAGGAVEAMRRNRYTNILANDHSRVVLCEGRCDYVNANFVGEGYVATQAPTKETFGHFWQMVFEGGVRVVVMLTREVEKRGLGGRRGFVVKSDRYWPGVGEEVVFGNFLVVGVGVRGEDEAIVERRFEVSAVDGRGRRRRHSGVLEVIQLQYVDWPDQDVPESPRALLDLRLRAEIYNRRESGESASGSGSSGASGANRSAPLPRVVVHCSAGVGRSGAFIAVDQTLGKVRSAYQSGTFQGDDPKCVPDIYDCVLALKIARSKMVQTWEQYRFIFEAVHEGVEAMIAGVDLAHLSFSGRRRHSTATDDDDPANSTPDLQLNNVLPTFALNGQMERL